MTEGTQAAQAPEPCTRKAFCSTLRDALNVPGYQGPGLSVSSSEVRMVFGSQGPTTQRLGVRYQRNGSSNTVLLNVCPFCGGNLQFWMVEHG